MIKVSENLYRGPAVDIATLPSDIKVVINLQTDLPELWFGDVNKELRSCVFRQMFFYDFEVSPFRKMWPEDLMLVVSMMKQQADGYKTYIHCRHGRERTGLVCAAYRILVDKWSVDKAYQEMIDLGCRWPWRWFYKKYLKEIAGE